MQEVAVAATVAMAFCVFAALCFSEVGHRHELGHDAAARVVQPLHGLHCEFRGVFVHKLNPHVANHVVSNIVGHNEIFNFTVLGELHKDFFVKVLKMVDSVDELSLGDVELVGLRDGRVGILVEMLEDHRLREGRFVVEPSAGVPMATGSDFEIKGTVYLVLFGAVNTSEFFSHK